MVRLWASLKAPETAKGQVQLMACMVQWWAYEMVSALLSAVLSVLSALLSAVLSVLSALPSAVLSVQSALPSVEL
jgi:hypothetical protein